MDCAKVTFRCSNGMQSQQPTNFNSLVPCMSRMIKRMIAKHVVSKVEHLSKPERGERIKQVEQVPVGVKKTLHNNDRPLRWRRAHLAVGQNPVPSANIPIPTQIGSKMGGEFTYQPKWYPKTVLTTTAISGAKPGGRVPPIWLRLPSIPMSRTRRAPGGSPGLGAAPLRRAAALGPRGAAGVELHPKDGGISPTSGWLGGGRMI